MNRYSGAMKCFAASCALSVFPLASFAQNYVQTNLVSDIPQVPNADGTSVTIDAHLKNVWGMSRGAASPWWVSNNGTGTSTLYSGAGVITQLVVTVPNAMGVNAPSRPTGQIFNGSTEFEIAPASNPAAKNPAAFIFATNNGTISAWGPPATPVAANGASTALQEVDESKQGANFVGLTWVESEGNHFLLAANFSGNKIEMFDGNFKRVQLSREAFDDDRIPREFAPYNVKRWAPMSS